MAVSTVDQFLSALEKSKLLGSDQLLTAQRLAGQSRDAVALAKALARENLVSRWQAGTLLALGRRAQFRLGKYKLIQQLGKGGMGTVFLAEHVTMNRRVALKIVPRSIAKNRASLDRFFAEARAIAALDHPNIVQAYSVDNEMDRYFIVMEFADGHDLQRLVEIDGPLDFDQAADYIRQAAEGLAHAHVRNLVHCDIKPANLLVNNQGVIKILDLGLARLKQGEEPRDSASGEPAFGTVDYMAPEQALETADFDHRADIYSLGCTLYYLLTGHPPFPEGSLAQRILKHQTMEPRDILLDRPNTPPRLIEVCKRMMAKSPENRYQSAQEVSAALAPWRSGSTSAPVRALPLAVKPLDDIEVAAAGAEDWFSFLPGAKASGTQNAADDSGNSPRSALTTTTLGKYGKQTRDGRSRGPVAAALARLLTFSRAKLGWFNTVPRKILGGLAILVLLAMTAGLAAMPFLRSDSASAPQVAAQPKAEEKDKQALAEEDVGVPHDKSPVNKSDTSQGPRGKDTSFGMAEVPNTQKPPSDNPQKTLPPSGGPLKDKPPKSDKLLPKPAGKVDLLPDGKTLAKSGPKRDFKSLKKPEPPVKTVSLDGLETAIELPPLGKGAATAVSLGKLDLDPKLTLDVQLLGGDAVAKSNPSFAIQKDGDAATASWSIQMNEKGKDAVPVARVRREEKELKIEWTEDAKSKATLLRYCGLRFSCEKKTHFVALTRPKIVPPLLIDVETGDSRETLIKDAPLPDLSVLRLQILPLAPSMPKHEIKVLLVKTRLGRSQGKSVEAVGGDAVSIKRSMLVLLTKEKTPRAAFTIAFDVHGKDLALDMRGAFEFAGVKLPLDWANLRDAAAHVEAWLMMNDSDKNFNRKNMKEPIEAMKTTRDQLKALGDLAGSLDRKGSIPFRVYADLGASDGEAAPKVVIFQSGQVEDAKGGGAKKSVKGKQAKGRATPDPDEMELK